MPPDVFFEFQRLKCTKFDSLGELKALPRSSTAVFKGPTCKGRDAEERGEDKGGRKRRESGGKGRGFAPKYFGLETSLEATTQVAEIRHCRVYWSRPPS